MYFSVFSMGFPLCNEPAYMLLVCFYTATCLIKDLKHKKIANVKLLTIDVLSFPWVYSRLKV
jgi:hypothetical protein